MTFFDAYDDEREELRALDRAERRRLLGHWCTVCHGHTGPDSPCYVEPEPSEDDEQESDE